MFDVQSYLERLTALLREAYGERLVYVGLQGSDPRGEATEESDIDVMAVVDDLSPSDLDAYRRAIYSLEEPEKSCGFIATRAESLMHWNPLEIAHLAHTTRDYYGALSALLPAYTESDVRNFVRVSVGNLYHEPCHRYIHSGRERSAERLPGVYKGGVLHPAKPVFPAKRRIRADPGGAAGASVGPGSCRAGARHGASSRREIRF